MLLVKIYAFLRAADKRGPASLVRASHRNRELRLNQIAANTADCRVLHVINDLASGGAERMLSRLVTVPGEEYGPMLRHEVVSLTDIGVYGPALRRQGVPVRTLGLRGFAGLPRAVVRLAQHIRRTQPDIVQTWLYQADFVGLFASTLSRSRAAVVWNVRCSDMDLGRYAWTSRVLFRILARLSHRPAAVIVNSEVGRDWHVAAGYRPKQWQVIPNGFDVEAHAPDADARARTRARLGLDAGQLVFACPARVDPKKDHATLLEAFAHHLRRHPHSRLLLLGRGTDTGDGPLTKLRDDPTVRNAVLGLGERTGDYWELLQTADSVVLASAFGEGFPNVLGEAMCLELPCITTQVGDAGAVVADTGWTVPRRDPEALAEAMAAFAELSPEARRTLGADARRRIIENFSLVRVAGVYRSFYGRLRRPTPSCR